MAYTLPGCMIGYLIVAVVFRKFFGMNFGWGRGILVFIVGWVLATVPGWISGGEEIYVSGMILLWPILSYTVVFGVLRQLMKKHEPAEEGAPKESEVSSGLKDDESPS